MRIATALLFLAASCAMSMSFAQSEDQDHSAHHPVPAKEPAAAAEHEHGVSNADLLQENMKKVEALMRQLQMESDPARKRALLSQHLQALREQMRLILAERKPTKMSMNEEGKKDDAAKEGPAKEGMMRKGGMMGGGMMMHQKVEQRLDMLERLLQQVIEREAVEAGV